MAKLFDEIHPGEIMLEDFMKPMGISARQLAAVVVERMPHALMLMRSFMVYLMDKAEKIIPSLTPEQLMDEKPVMRPLAF